MRRIFLFMGRKHTKCTKHERSKSPIQLMSLRPNHWKMYNYANIKITQQLTSITWLQNYLDAHKHCRFWFQIQRVKGGPK